jgi:hypothetical protein
LEKAGKGRWSKREVLMLMCKLQMDVASICAEGMKDQFVGSNQAVVCVFLLLVL